MSQLIKYDLTVSSSLRCLSSLKDERVLASQVLMGPEEDSLNNNNSSNRVKQVCFVQVTMSESLFDAC